MQKLIWRHRCSIADDFLTEIDAATADDAAIADLESELEIKRDVRDDKYVAAGDKRSKVGMGVAGDPAYGNVIRTGLMLNSTTATVDKCIAALDAGFKTL